MISDVELFKEELELHAGKKVELRINDNRSTMLSVKPSVGRVRVSLHQMFLKAPPHVVQALGGFIRRKTKHSHRAIQAYIEENLPQLDYTHRVDRSKLVTAGKVHDLEAIYNRINEEYFGGELNLLITWYGQGTRRKRNAVTFGLFHDPMKLVKIHRLLDDQVVPEYFVAYVVYHEVLHHVFPTVVGEDGRKQIHHEQFKKYEERFEEYEQAQRWLKENRQALFDGTF